MNEHGDICDFTMLRWADDRTSTIDQLRLRKILEMSAASNFEYVCLVNVKSKVYSTFSRDAGNSHDVPETGDFEEISRYICDPETYEVIYLSRACMDLCGLQSPQEYRGQKCYKVLQGLDAPCPFCTNQYLSDEAEYSWEHYNEKLGKWFDVTDSLVHLEGRLCCLEIARDITARKVELNDLAEQLALEDELFRCLNTLTKVRDLRKH